MLLTPELPIPTFTEPVKTLEPKVVNYFFYVPQTTDEQRWARNDEQLYLDQIESEDNNFLYEGGDEF